MSGNPSKNSSSGSAKSSSTPPRERPVLQPDPEYGEKLLSLHKQLFCEPSPAPTKWAMAQLGRCRPTVRLPILELTEAGQASVGAAMRDAGLL
jgi:dihydrodipicolinate synthase/N-acetylneuraminate lyase